MHKAILFDLGRVLVHFDFERGYRALEPLCSLPAAEIPGILHMSVDPLPTMHPSGEKWTNIGHPVSPDTMVMAVGAAGNTFSDHGMRWDNSGRNGLYAPIRWSNQA